MKLGKASEYAIFATLYIAKHDIEGPVHGRRIAETYGISNEYLLKILQRLVRARVIQSERGRRGGFRQRKPAMETTLLDIVEAIEGPLEGELVTYQDVDGVEGTKEKIQNMCCEIARFTQSILRQTTIKQLLDAA